MNNSKVVKGFSGDAEVYDLYVKLYNEFSDKLEELGASDEMFTELNSLCEASRNIYR